MDIDKEQEAQGLGALLDKMEDNDHINWITQRSRLSCTLKPAVLETQNGALLDKMEDNDHINWITQRFRLSCTLKPAVLETQSF